MSSSCTHCLLVTWSRVKARGSIVAAIDLLLVTWGGHFFSLVWPLPGLRSAELLTACYRSTCLRIWFASLDFVQLPFRYICTSSASLLVKWRMKNSRGKENSSNQMLRENVLVLTWTDCDQALITCLETRRSDCTRQTCGPASRSFSTPSLLEFSN